MRARAPQLSRHRVDRCAQSAAREVRPRLARESEPVLHHHHHQRARHDRRQDQRPVKTDSRQARGPLGGNSPTPTCKWPTEPPRNSIEPIRSAPSHQTDPTKGWFHFTSDVFHGWNRAQTNTRHGGVLHELLPPAHKHRARDRGSGGITMFLFVLARFVDPRGNACAQEAQT